MTELFSEGGWLRPSLLALLFWGLWGLLTKIGADKVPWQTMLIFFSLGALMVGLIAKPTMPTLDRYHLIGLLAGISCAFGFMFFYIAIARGEASVVIPVTSLYVAVATIMAFLLLAEPLTIKKTLGILSAIVAIVLLSG